MVGGGLENICSSLEVFDFDANDGRRRREDRIVAGDGTWPVWAVCCADVARDLEPPSLCSHYYETDMKKSRPG
jgi:hypothetical protein